jgi:hypothetical protein
MSSVMQSKRLTEDPHIASGFKVFLCSYRPIAIVMAVASLPWILTVLATSGGRTALALVGYLLVALAAGYFAIRLAVPNIAGTERMLFSPAIGVVLISALTAFSLRLGLPISLAPIIWGVLGLCGALRLWSDRNLLAKASTAYGSALIGLSVLICLVYFLPAARNDAVLRPDGSFNWIYVDTQMFHSMAASIKSVDTPPKIPGTATAPLLYHFGPYAPSAVISRTTGLNLGDAIARVTHGTELWALIFSCFGLGMLLSLKATGQPFGGLMSVAGLFFYGALLSLFTDELNSASHITGAILYKIPDIGVVADGGPFSHFLLGGSVLHGLVAITAIVGLCVAKMGQGTVLSRTGIAFLVFPALAVPIHSVAALYCLGVMGVLLFWGSLDKASSWLAILLTLCAFLGAWKIMGFSHGPDASVTVNRDALQVWWPLTVWFVIGLGLRIVGFRWISRSIRDPFSVVFIASVLGLLFFSIVLDLELSAERYGIYFLQSLLSIFAFSRFTPGFWRGQERSELAKDWVKFAKRGLLLLLATALFLRVAVYVAKSHSWTASFRREVVPAFVLFLLLIGVSRLMKRSERFSSLASAALICVLMVGFLAWITPWINFGLGRMHMDVTLSPGEVRGLNRLNELSKPDERFATNKHVVDSLVSLRERSYAYGTLSERPVLLEGYAYRGEYKAAGFLTLLHDNDSMFTTTDSQALHETARNYQVRWLVARPGTDIALAKPLPSWLVEESNSGDLKIYKID